ncbi:MAG: peptidyl-prolyl cis-trans isomerase A (cyclophilin A) [Alteromonadaceae bacterium]|jgi:peptidyl-prolyl cis-trans isomerase A (cyclophilin A)
MFRKLFNSLFSPVAIVLSATIALPSFATIVEFETSHGKFKINLHDETTPKTVENFLSYVNDGSYNDTIVHRNALTQTGENFVIQGGGFRFEGALPPVGIETRPTIVNEPLYSNVVGTIAMAKGSNANSATSQWFINLKDNSFLDSNAKGAFTAFGEVIADDMTTIEAIAATPRCDLGVPFNEIPMPNYVCTDGGAGTENFVTIISVTISDSSVTSASSLTPVMNTSLTSTPTPTTPTKSSSGGGSMTWLMLSLLSLFSISRKFIKKS